MDSRPKIRAATTQYREILTEELSKRKALGKSEREHVMTVVYKFFRYAFLASIHGYGISLSTKGRWPKFKFRFRYIKVDNMPERLSKKIVFSPKAFGYFFIIGIEIPPVTKAGFRFRILGELRDQAIALTETDKVYDLIKHR